MARSLALPTLGVLALAGGALEFTSEGLPLPK